MFPTWSEVLEVLVSLGYEKVTDDDGDHKVAALAAAPARLAAN
jgi:hypothetical protein